jgi:hypothetical protein
LPNDHDEPRAERVGSGDWFGDLDSGSKCDILGGCPIHNFTQRKGIPSR